MRYLITCLFICIGSFAFSQGIPDSAEIKNTTIEFNGGKYNGYQMELNAPPDIVEDAMKEKFKTQGLKPKEIKDFLVYRNVLIPAIDASKPVDAFIKIERKSKKEKEQSTIYFIAAVPGEIPDDKIKSDAAARSLGITAVESGGMFLTSMLPSIKKGVHNNNIANQQSVVKKEEKKLSELKDDQEDLEKKLKKIQSDLEYNKKAQERQVTEVEKAKTTLDQLNAKKDD